MQSSNTGISDESESAVVTDSQPKPGSSGDVIGQGPMDSLVADGFRVGRDREHQ